MNAVIMKKIRKKFTFLFSTALLCSSLFLISCEDDALACDRCSDDTPFSPASGGACYETQSDCESATGSNCIRCTG